MDFDDFQRLMESLEKDEPGEPIQLPRVLLYNLLAWLGWYLVETEWCQRAPGRERERQMAWHIQERLDELSPDWRTNQRPFADVAVEDQVLLNRCALLFASLSLDGWAPMAPIYAN
ncbi:MAG: hypothetical protein QJR07_19075 [Acetobacteraceae bacterium]|nr:hypothetical protein [Acetobacteraceae bacterium]